MAGSQGSSFPRPRSFFTDTDVRHLRQYRYSSIDNSFIANRILNPYWWTPLVQAFPTWVAPNAITFSGFMFVVFNLLTLLTVAPTLTESVPSWAYFSFFIGMFMYQSFDAIDGKQARRTGTSGPLGELFDHGCDALNTGLGSIIGATALGVGPSGWLIFTLLSTLSNFYLSTWEEYHTGTLYLSYCSGPVEGLLSVCFVFLVSSIYGHEIWRTPLSIALQGWIKDDVLGEYWGSFGVNHVMILVGLIIVLFNIVSSGYNVILARAQRSQSPLPPFLGLIPLLGFLLVAAVWPLLSPTLIPHHVVPYAICISFLAGLHVGVIIVHHVSKRGYPYWPPGLWVLGLGAAAALGVRRWVEMDPVEAVGACWAVVRTAQGIPGFGNLLELLGPTISVSTAIAIRRGSGLNPDGPVAGFIRNLLLNGSVGFAPAPASSSFVGDDPALVAVEGAIAWALAGTAFWLYARTVGTVVSELCDIFDIWCFKVGKRSGVKVKVDAGSEGKDGGAEEDGPIARRTRAAKAKKRVD
ncbi:hypothetical protein HDU96_006905 [Phlyctochytrium bullatum]|nr:hypothetical protein HDU96_006905 [Phlyctochytrium bullatum]